MDELRWYLYDLVREIMEKHGIEETAYSLETVREGAVCLIPSAHGFLVNGGGDEDSEQEDFYRGCRAVSYTHLDVYKRQDHRRRNMGGAYRNSG